MRVFGEFCEILYWQKWLCSSQQNIIPHSFHFFFTFCFQCLPHTDFLWNSGIIDLPPLLVGLLSSRWVILSLSVPQQFLHESLMAPLRLLMGVWMSCDFHIHSSYTYFWNLKWLFTFMIQPSKWKVQEQLSWIWILASCMEMICSLAICCTLVTLQFLPSTWIIDNFLNRGS